MAQARYGALDYAGGHLTWDGGRTRAAIGSAGVRAEKREGDGATPSGTYPLLGTFYRPDRVLRPRTGLALTNLDPGYGWVDDPGDAQYNRLVSLPYPASAERMWREDGLYDLVVVIGYNSGPVVPGAGSAIFLHVARPDFAPTQGCIAVALTALAEILATLGPGSTITIAP